MGRDRGTAFERHGRDVARRQHALRVDPPGVPAGFGDDGAGRCRPSAASRRFFGPRDQAPSRRASVKDGNQFDARVAPFTKDVAIVGERSSAGASASQNSESPQGANRGKSGRPHRRDSTRGRTLGFSEHRASGSGERPTCETVTPGSEHARAAYQAEVRSAGGFMSAPPGSRSSSQAAFRLRMSHDGFRAATTSTLSHANSRLAAGWTSFSSPALGRLKASNRWSVATDRDCPEHAGELQPNVPLTAIDESGAGERADGGYCSEDVAFS
jgi:hypothetical protein